MPTPRIVARAEMWLFSVLVLLVAAAPLPLGSNRPLSSGVVAFVAGVLLLSWVAIATLRGSLHTDRDLTRRLKWPIGLFLIVIVWIVVQWAPLGFSGHPLWQTAADALGEDLPARITLNPEASLAALSNLLCYGAVFWISLQLTVDPARARLARYAAIAIGGAYCLYGLVGFFIDGAWISAYFLTRRADSLTSTFVNRNSFATFAGLALLCSASVFLDRVQHIFTISRPFGQKIVLVVEMVTVHARWVSAAFVTASLALFLTTSRGGIAASLVALTALVFLQTRSAAKRGAAYRYIPLLILLPVGIALVLGGGNFLERVDRQGLSIENNLRSSIFVTTIEAIKTAPLVGTGYGTYSDAIEAYRGGDPDIFTLWQKAHNTYLENALELGLPGAAALTLSVLGIALICFGGVQRRRRNRAYPAVGVAATILVGVHALVDFSLQIPAVAIFYAFIMGVAVAQSVRGRTENDGATDTSRPTRRKNTGPESDYSK